MELKDFKDTLLQKWGLESSKDLSSFIKEQLLSSNYKIVEDYASLVDGEKDMIQALYQFYLAKRGGDYQQDYTPLAFHNVMNAILDVKEGMLVYDMCAGMGSLTIGLNRKYPNLEYVCHELDREVIPFLLFNLVYHNINATVLVGDVFREQYANIYRVVPGERFSIVSELNEFAHKQYDICISNPPYNLKGNMPEYLKRDGFTDKNRDMNWHFILNALYRVKEEGQAFFILPGGVFGGKSFTEYRRQLTKNVKYIVECPENMFESTPVSTSCLVLSNTESDVIKFACLQDNDEYVVREQYGEGKAAHRNRLYTKTFNYISEETMHKVLQNWTINESVDDLICIVENQDILEHYVVAWSGRLYEEILAEHCDHRPFKDILADLNRVQEEKNSIKITINKVWAKELGVDKLSPDAEEIEEEMKISQSIQESLSRLNFKEDVPKLLESKEIVKITPNAGDFKIENTIKGRIPSYMKFVLPIIIQGYKHHIYYLNEESNRLLVELRDALINELMLGKLVFQEDNNM